MKYPMAGDLQRQTTSHLATNPDRGSDDALDLFITNDGELYEKYRKPISKKLAEAKALGDSSRTRAVREFLKLADVGAKKYQREVEARYFTSDEKRAYAESAVEYFETEWSLGNFRDYAAGAQQWNPSTSNPYEVRSDSGLEGVFADEHDAMFYADELRGVGAKRVEVVKRTRQRPGSAPRQNPIRCQETEQPLNDTSVVGIDPYGDMYILDTQTGVGFTGPSVRKIAEARGIQLSNAPAGNPPKIQRDRQLHTERKHPRTGAIVGLTKDGIPYTVGHPSVIYSGPAAWEYAEEMGMVKTKSNPHANPEDQLDTEILAGMERAIWVAAWANWVDELSKDERKRHGVPVSLQGLDYSEAAPPAPASALLAAQDLYVLIERANGKTPGELFREACEADGCEWNDANADLFGHYLAMQGMGHGVSWFDDHKEFPLKFPRHFEAYYADGEVWWSPQVRGRENPRRAR